LPEPAYDAYADTREKLYEFTEGLNVYE